MEQLCGMDIWTQAGPGGQKNKEINEMGIQLLLLNMKHVLVFECRGTKAKKGEGITTK